ncbi:hypothetical protein H310_12384 [Aphanomyces invadans]|uniref:Uncharacterized protein n=1 Tax=Aphanomyces invadans TaxID=157072 RepID=A0A024TJP1_9STRA|nr:hypothetical protein H310_12384 [Aphanomyces invadans]ETV93821.1 hypothetical protein H310_12384 [Aphanomyces invadans]|eukprot:XP_008877630.1 hypothetical protein H310_12384 [Aphanomyces invadans]
MMLETQRGSIRLERNRILFLGDVHLPPRFRFLHVAPCFVLGIKFGTCYGAALHRQVWTCAFRQRLGFYLLGEEGPTPGHDRRRLEHHLLQSRFLLLHLQLCQTLLGQLVKAFSRHVERLDLCQRHALYIGVETLRSVIQWKRSCLEDTLQRGGFEVGLDLDMELFLIRFVSAHTLQIGAHWYCRCRPTRGHNFPTLDRRHRVGVEGLCQLHPIDVFDFEWGASAFVGVEIG